MLELTTDRRQTATRTGRRDARAAAAAIFMGAVAVLVSAAGSWVPSYWGDEAASVLSARRPIESLWTMLTNLDAVHGLYYLGLKLWIDAFGSSPVATRFPSALAIGVCAAGVVWLCRRFGPLPFAVTAGAATALLPRLTFAGEEARSYAFAAAIATIVCVLLVEAAFDDPSRRGAWVGYSIALAVGMHAFLYTGLMIPAIAVMVAVSPALRRRWRPWLVATLAAVAASAPIVVAGYLQRDQIAFLERRDVLTPHAVFVEMWFGYRPFAIAAWAVILLAIGAFVWNLRRDRLAHRSEGIRLEVVVLTWMVVPMGLLIAVSFWTDTYTARYGTFAAPAAAVMIALGLRALWRVRWGAISAAVVLAILVAPVWESQRSPYGKDDSDWNDIAATIEARAVEGDAIVFGEANRPSRRTRLAMSTDPAPFADVRDVTLDVPYVESATTWHDTAYTVAEAARLGRFDGVTRVWVVQYSLGGPGGTWGLDDLRALGFRQSERIDGHRSVVYLFSR